MTNKNNHFNEKGIFCIENCLSKNSLDKFYSTLLDIAFFHLKKVGEHSKKLENIYNSKKNFGEKLSLMFEIFESNDKEMLYQLQKLFASSNDLRNILENNELKKTFRDFLNIKNNVPLLINGPGVFVNRPNTKRLLYKWHSESHYYPKRRNFLNIWFPISLICWEIYLLMNIKDLIKNQKIKKIILYNMRYLKILLKI